MCFIFEVLCHDKKTRSGYYPVLQDTELGLIVSGKMPLAAPEELPRKSFFIRKKWQLRSAISKILGNRRIAQKNMDNWRNFVWRTLQESYRTRRHRTVYYETSSTWRSRSSRRVVWTGKAMISSARAAVPGTSRFASSILWIYPRIWRTGSYEPD